MYKKIIAALIFAISVLILSGCSAKPIENEIIYLAGLAPEEHWTEKNKHYYFADNYDDFKALLGKKIFLYEEDLQRINNQDFFEEKMMVFVRVDSSQGIESVDVTTHLKGRTLQIKIVVNTDFTMAFDAEALGIILDKTKIRRIKLNVFAVL